MVSRSVFALLVYSIATSFAGMGTIDFPVKIASIVCLCCESDFSLILTLNGGDVNDVVVERNGELVELNDFFLECHEVTNEDGSKSAKLGFSFVILEPNFGDKLEYVWNMAVSWVRTVRLSLQMLFSGKASISDVSGPVGIVDQMVDVATSSETAWDAVMNLLYFGAFIAVNLAIMNLLPIPALDGGRVVALLLTTGIEAITHKKIDPKYEGYIHAGGMILLLLLMAVILFKDAIFLFK